MATTVGKRLEETSEEITLALSELRASNERLQAAGVDGVEVDGMVAAAASMEAVIHVSRAVIAAARDARGAVENAVEAVAAAVAERAVERAFSAAIDAAFQQAVTQQAAETTIIGVDIKPNLPLLDHRFVPRAAGVLWCVHERVCPTPGTAGGFAVSERALKIAGVL